MKCIKRRTRSQSECIRFLDPSFCYTIALPNDETKQMGQTLRCSGPENVLCHRRSPKQRSKLAKGSAFPEELASTDRKLNHDELHLEDAASSCHPRLVRALMIGGLILAIHPALRCDLYIGLMAYGSMFRGALIVELKQTKGITTDSLSSHSSAHLFFCEKLYLFISSSHI
jgi:hypothetical protein